MANNDVKNCIRENGLAQWQVSKMIGISESYFSKILRDELPDDYKNALISAINKLGSGEFPDLSYFENRKKTANLEKLRRKSCAEQKRIDKILLEIEERRREGGWGV